MAADSPRIFIQNPHHSYGKEFVRIFASKYGLKSVCSYTDERDAKVWLPRHPSLLTNDVAASLYSPPANVESLIEFLQANYNIVAAIPHNEIVLANTVRINEALGLDWVPAKTMRRFRNKESLKEFVRQQDPNLGISPTVIVRDVRDVREAMDANGFKKVVIKPNDGWGNLGVGFFDTASSDSDVGAFLAEIGDHDALLEEFFGGREFYSCGQVDARGDVTTFALFETIKGAANGRSNIDFEVRLIHTTDPVFDVLMDFSAGVVRATGLTRSPFHVDLKLDDGVPKLIEMGARMVGDSRAYDLNHVHGGGLNVFDLSAHYYLNEQPYGDIGLDWDRYDAMAFRSVQGINDHAQRLYAFGGAKRVESLREFVRWAHEPEVGDPLPVTLDLLSAPWQVTVQAESEPALDAVSRNIRRTLTINKVTSPLKRSALKAKSLLPGVRRQFKLRTSPIKLIHVPENPPKALTAGLNEVGGE